MPATNIIQRRDLEPLWIKAGEIARHYERAGNCISALVGPDYVSTEPSRHPKNGVFCALCKRYYSGMLELPLSDIPCSSMHRNAIRESLRLGGSYIYTCSMGFYFWTSPFFSMERFAGAFVSSGAISIEKQQVVDRVFDTCKGDVSRAEISGLLDCIPEKNIVEIEALAQMMVLCTEHISRREFWRDGLAEYGEAEPLSQNSLPKGYLSTFADRERMLLANLRRGDSSEAQDIARELLSDLCKALDVSMGGGDALADGHLELLKFKALEMVVLLSRAGATDEKNELLVEANIHNMKRIKGSKTADEVIDNFCLVVERMAGKIFSFQGIRHASALRKAERYIWDNYTRKVSLKEIADVSGLSAPYFSTIFKDEMKENLSDYLNRLRVEKASTMLLETDLLVSEISAACGFEDQSWFSKIFKNHTGISPCKYRRTVGAAPVEITPLEQGYKHR
ncbi:MAG: helix-turn-helix domain-containing protein [Treponema sp.]|nr:helix-turn-helix domain-containing protein [Treponema sp.]MCL2190758.1 helix-turn-helix domain-containing protein [Treponema sp.]